MCRTKKIAPRSSPIITTKKKKTCCEKFGPKACCMRIRGFFIKKLKRYVKKKIFGVPEPKLHEYEVAGVNLGSLKDTILQNKDELHAFEVAGINLGSLKDKILQNKDKLHVSEVAGINLGSVKDKILQNKDKLQASEVGGINLGNLKDKILQNKDKLYASEVAGANLGSVKDKILQNKDKLHASEVAGVNLGSVKDKVLQNKDKLHTSEVAGVNLGTVKDNILQNKDKLHEYEVAGINIGSIKDKMFPSKIRSLTSLVNQNRKMTKLYIKDLDLIKGMDANELEKKFSVSPSKSKVLDKLVEDYNKGRLSVSKMPDKTIFKSKKLNKEKLNKIIEDYDIIKNRSKSRSAKIIEKLREMDPTELKKKFSLTSSRHRILEHMVDDYRNRKVSFSKLWSNKSKFSSLSSRGMSKGQVNEMLQDYEVQKKNIKVPFSLPSKLGSFAPLIDEIKNARISISSVKKVFKK